MRRMGLDGVLSIVSEVGMLIMHIYGTEGVRIISQQNNPHLSQIYLSSLMKGENVRNKRDQHLDNSIFVLRTLRRWDKKSMDLW